MISAAVVLGLLLAFCFGTSDYLSKGLSNKVGFYRATVYTLATSGALLIVPTLFLGGLTWPSPFDAAVLLLISVSMFVAFVLMYRGYQRGKLSIISPTVNSFPIFSVIFSIFILKIELSEGELIALSGVIVAIILVSTSVSNADSSDGRRRTVTPGIPEAILSAFLFAVALTSLGYADEKMGYLLPTISARLGAAAVGFLAGVVWKEDLRPVSGRPLRRLLVMGTLEASGLLAFNLALYYSSTIAALPITTTLGGMGAVFTVGFALIFLKEKVRPNYAVGIVVVIASVAALLYLTA